MIGRNVAHYEIVRKIGAGGMGVVWLARDTRLQRPVALKFLRAEDQPGRPRDTLLREARAASALNHPNICTIHAVGESGADAYIVMEYVEGETLSDRIAARSLSPAEVLALGTQIASALAHAHGRGVVHRDLKSANVMVGPEDRVKVLDFGLSQRLGTVDDDVTRRPETMTEAGVLAGTPAYLSPEILRGGSADERADLWALGVTLYEMCAGRRPFAGVTPFETTAAILDTEPPPLPPATPPPVRAVVDRCLAKEPAARFPTARALGEALEAVARGEGHGAAPAAMRTLAVLPFENLAGDDAQEFFADGMTEAITAAVARLGSIRVISRTSAMQFKHERPPLPEIARRLGADAVVEGSVLRAGERVRITAQLLDARTDEHLWADTFDRALVDVLDLLDDVARAIVEGIRPRIAGTRPGIAETSATPPSRARPVAALAGTSPIPPPPAAASPAGSTRSSRRVDPDAYEEYLRGRHAWAKRTPPSLRRAIAHYERAVELDPAYARAHVGVAECYAVLGFMGAAAPRNSFAPAKTAARRALELDPSLGSAHMVLGYVATHDRWELDSATTAFDEGLRLEADDSNGRHWYALLLTSRGDRDGAIEQMRLAAELDPLSLIVRAATGLVLHFFGEFEAAMAECRDALDMSPEYPAARWTLARALLGQGEVERACELLEVLVANSERLPFALADYGRALALCGRRDEARRVCQQLRSAADRSYVRPYDHALVHMGLHEHDAAVAWLEKAFHERGNWLNYLHLDPAFADLRGDARLEALVRRVAGSDE